MKYKNVVIPVRDGHIIGRNGTFMIKKLSIWTTEAGINISGIGKRGNEINGGLWIDHEAFLRLLQIED